MQRSACRAIFYYAAADAATPPRRSFDAAAFAMIISAITFDTPPPADYAYAIC